jgi:hypothetical protein
MIRKSSLIRQKDATASTDPVVPRSPEVGLWDALLKLKRLRVSNPRRAGQNGKKLGFRK